MCRAELNGIFSGATFCLSALLANLADYSFHPALQFCSSPFKTDTNTTATTTTNDVLLFVNDEHSIKLFHLSHTCSLAKSRVELRPGRAVRIPSVLDSFTFVEWRQLISRERMKSTCTLHPVKPARWIVTRSSLLDCI